MENWLFNILDLPAESEVEQSLTREFFNKNFTLTPSEKNLLNYSIDQTMIVGAVGPTYGNVPSYKDDEQNIESVVVILVETKGGKMAKEAAKIADMLQKHLPQYVLIGITDSEKVCLSIASRCKDADDDSKLVIKESFLSPIMTIEELMEHAQDFSFDKVAKDNLNTLWNSYCQLVKNTMA